MSSSSHQDPCRDAHHGASACSSSDPYTPADLGQQDEESETYGMVEIGPQLMLQQHLHHFGALTLNEQQRWKQPIINALRSKSFNDGSKYFFREITLTFQRRVYAFFVTLYISLLAMAKSQQFATCSQRICSAIA